MIVLDLGYIFSRSAFACEIIIFAAIYMCGTDNFAQLKELKRACKDLNQVIAEKKSAVTKLEQRIIAWNVHPFYKEKMAREQLQMGHDDELIYFMS